MGRLKRGLLLTLLLAALLCACGVQPIPQGEEAASAVSAEPEQTPEPTNDPADVVEVIAVLSAEELAALDRYPNLQKADLSGSTCYDELLAWAEEHPDVELLYTLELPCGTVKNSDTTLDLSALTDAELADALAQLRYLPAVEEIRLGDCKLSELEALRAQYPQIAFDWSFSLLGETHSTLDTEIDLRALPAHRVEEAARLLACMPRLETFRLAGEDAEEHLGWAEIRTLCEAAPTAAPDFSFTLYDVPLNTADTVMDINHRKVTDNCARIREILPCMPRLETLIMDSCGVGDEEMDKLRSEFPDVEVVWRIWFGTGYSVRTNVEKILASQTSKGGVVDDREAAKLRYCTHIKYLDLGHNESITDLSFLTSMPDLEVLIIAMNPLGDLTPLASCPKLEYLEMFFSDIYDISPLAECHELRHLNIGMCDYLTDITALYGLEHLERVYIGCLTPIPPEQVEELRRLHPDCEINDVDYDTSVGAWRWTHDYDEDPEFMAQDYYREGLAPRYALLRQQFDYDHRAYSFAWLDPYNTWQNG